MGSKGKVTFIYANESGDVQTGLTSVYLCKAGSTPGGASAVQMTDADTNGTYIVDIEDDIEGIGLNSELVADIYAAGTLEIEDFVVISKDLIDDVAAHGASITDHESAISTLETNLATATGDIDSLQGSVSNLVSDVAGISSSLNTHTADSSDPHGATLTQTRIITNEIAGASGSPLEIKPRDTQGQVELGILNAGGSGNYAAHLRLKYGEFRFTTSSNRTRLYPLPLSSGDAGFVMDIRNSGSDTNLWIANSEVGYKCKLVVDGGISADVDEVVTARSTYSTLNNRINAIESNIPEVTSYQQSNVSIFEASATASIPTIDYTYVCMVTIPYSLIVNQMIVYCDTLHASTNYDFGLYDLNGSKICSTGAVQLSSTGVLKLSLGASYNISPGVYFFAWTAGSLTGVLYGVNQPIIALQGWGYITSGGSTLPSSITPSSIVEDKGFYPLMILNLSTIP